MSIINPNVVQYVYDKLDNFLTPINQWEKDYGVKPILGVAPKFVIKQLPDGSKIKIIKEGVSGASRRAKRDLKAVDTYIKRTPEATVDKNRVVSNMMKDGIDVSTKDENRIFGEIANGKAALYDKYLK